MDRNPLEREQKEKRLAYHYGTECCSGKGHSASHSATNQKNCGAVGLPTSRLATRAFGLPSVSRRCVLWCGQILKEWQSSFWNAINSITVIRAPTEWSSNSEIASVLSSWSWKQLSSANARICSPAEGGNNSGVWWENPIGFSEEPIQSSLNLQTPASTAHFICASAAWPALMFCF